MYGANFTPSKQAIPPRSTFIPQYRIAILLNPIAIKLKSLKTVPFVPDFQHFQRRPLDPLITVNPTLKDFMHTPNKIWDTTVPPTTASSFYLNLYLTNEP